MAINTLEFATKYTGELDKKVVQDAVTGFFADNTFRSKFVGAKTVIVPDIDMVGLADYDRDTGYTEGGITVTNTPFTLTKDRNRKLVIDREDMDETGIANLSGQIMQEFIRTKVAPEIDAYTLSKLAQVAEEKGHSADYLSSKPLAQLNDVINSIWSKAGYSEELVAFVHPVFYSALMNSTEFNRQVIVSDFKQGELSFKVKTINGVALIPVAADRMKTAYDFGADGFTAAEGAKDIYSLVIPKKAASLVKKTETVRIFEPNENKDRDAYEFNYRLYYDVFVKKSNLDFIETITKAI